MSGAQRGLEKQLYAENMKKKGKENEDMIQEKYSKERIEFM